MPPLILDIVVDEEGQPVPQRTACTVEQYRSMVSSTLSPAESIPMQAVMQREAQAFHAVQALNPIATQAADALHLLHSQALSDFQWQKNIAAKAQAALLTVNTPFQKMWASMAEEHTRSQLFQKELWSSALPLIETRWKAEQEQRQRIEASFRAMAGHAQALINTAPPAWLAAMRAAQPLIDLRWQEERERLWGTQEQQQSLYVHLSQLADINELMHVYCPPYRDSRPESEQGIRLNAARTRLIAHMTPGLRNPWAARKVNRVSG